MSKLVVDPQTLRALQVTLQSTLANVQYEHRKVTNAGQRTLVDIGVAITVRRAKVQQCELALERCRESEDDSCSEEAAALSEARRRLAAAESARKLASQAVADHQSQANASLKRLEGVQSQGLLYLSAKLDRVLAVNAGGTSAAGTVLSATGDHGVEATTSKGDAVYSFPGLPPGYEMIPINLIDQTENPIHGIQDFGKGYSVEDLDYAFDLFETQVLPDLASGADAASFSALDRTNGVYGKRSLADTFSGFLGSDAIKLELRPNGTYAIINGRHRIYVASQYGRYSVPALISGRKS
jgi:hypothetical protein